MGRPKKKAENEIKDKESEKETKLSFAKVDIRDDICCHAPNACIYRVCDKTDKVIIVRSHMELAAKQIVITKEEFKKKGYYLHKFRKSR